MDLVIGMSGQRMASSMTFELNSLEQVKQDVLVNKFKKFVREFACSPKHGLRLLGSCAANSRLTILVAGTTLMRTRQMS